MTERSGERKQIVDSHYKPMRNLARCRSQWATPLRVNWKLGRLLPCEMEVSRQPPKAARYREKR